MAERRLTAALLFAMLAWTSLQSVGASAEGSATKLSHIGTAWTSLLSAPVSAKDRAVAARELKDFCQHYVDVIPTPSPRENDWLDAEMKAGRFETVGRSVEFSKRYASNRATNCLNYVKGLLKVQGIKSDGARKSEALLWALITHQLIDNDFQWHVDNLARHDVVTLSEQEVDDLQTARFVGHAIFENIIIPHLTKEAQ